LRTRHSDAGLRLSLTLARSFAKILTESEPGFGIAMQQNGGIKSVRVAL